MLRQQQGGVARNSSHRTAHRLGALAAGLLTAGLLVPSGAAAKSFTVGYDFGNDRAANAGWVPDNSPAPAEDPAGGDWYRSTFATGGGLRIVPKGNGDAPYKDVRGTWWYYAPSGSTIKRARVEGLNGRAVDRQIARAWLFDLKPDPPLPRPSNVSREIREAGTGPTTWNNTSFTLAPSAGMTSGGFGLWLYANPCGPDQDGGTCTPVGADSEAFISLRKLTMTLDDPTKATTKVDGLGDGTLWTNTNAVDLKVASSDPQSGVARIQAEVQTPAGTRRFALGEWRPDTLNSTARGPGVPPLAVDRSAERAITAAPNGRTRVTIRTTNGAGATTVSRGAVRVDRDKPTITWPRRLRPGAAVTVGDTGSGVESATLAIGDTTAPVSCAGGSRRCTLRVPDTSGTGLVAVAVRDRAGNVRSGVRTARGLPSVPPPADVRPEGPTIPVRNVRVFGPDGRPFVGTAELEWADPAFQKGDEGRDAYPSMFSGRVEGGVIPQLDVPEDAVSFGRGKRDATINLELSLFSEDGWSTSEFSTWDLGGSVGSAATERAATRALTAPPPVRPLPRVRRLPDLHVSKDNPMLEGFEGGRSRASTRSDNADAATPRAFPKCGTRQGKTFTYWAQYIREPRAEVPVKIFEAHSWTDESLTFFSSRVKSIKTGLAISGGLGDVGVVSAGVDLSKEVTRTVGTESETKAKDSRYRGYVEAQFNYSKVDYYLVDQNKFARWRYDRPRDEIKKGPKMPHGSVLEAMKCPGKPSRTGYAATSASSGLGFGPNGKAPKGEDGYTVRDRNDRGRSANLWDRQPSTQRSLSIKRSKSYTISKGFSVGVGAKGVSANVSMTQVDGDENSSAARWTFRGNDDHFFGGTSGDSISNWPVVYAGQKKRK